MASLVDQIFMQAQAGSAQGQGFGQFFAQGVQAGQNQQRINLEKQQLAMELAQLPLKQTLLQQSQQMSALKIEDVLRDRQLRIDNESAIGGLASRVYESMASGEPEQAGPLFWESLGKNPKLNEDPRFHQLWKDFNTSLDAKIALQQVRNAGKDSEYTPGFGIAVNPLTKQPTAYFNKGPHSAELVQEGTVIEQTSPDGTVNKVTIGGTGGSGSAAALNNGLAPAVVSDLEKRTGANLTSVALIQDAMTGISPKTVGPVGIINQGIETVGNIVAPGSVGTDVTSARQAMRIAAQKQYSSLKADAQINKLEASDMREIADITKIDISAPGATAKYQKLLDLTGLQTALMQHQLNKAAPDAALKAMSREAVARFYARGNLTEYEARRWAELTGYKPGQ